MTQTVASVFWRSETARNDQADQADSQGEQIVVSFHPLGRYLLRSTCRLALFGALPFLLSSALSGQLDNSPVPEANPARPTVSTPATLTPAGYLQFENGGLFAANSPEFSRRLGIEQATKLSIDSRVQLLALFEPFTHSTGGCPGVIGPAKSSPVCR